MQDKHKGLERREFARLDYVVPFACKVCKKETLSKILQGYTSDISQSGLLCRIQEKVNKDDILWLSFDKSVLSICADLDNRCLIYQNGIIGRAVRTEIKADGIYNVGIQFITREEKNPTHIYPEAHCLKNSDYKDEET